ncbi:MAG: PIN domain nuclease [Acidobacteria bacterium]|jgi:predicted nucleic acid-binding protein|nr:PIN domain nuclease [Acidobacteriota bacterium]
MVVVDTTVWIDYLKGRNSPETDWLDQQLSRQRIGLLDLMLCEILQGVSSEKEARLVEKHLLRFEIMESGGREIAVAAASNYRSLRRRGRTVRKTIDCLIATCCIRGGHQLLHGDRDFDPFEEFLGLTVIHP